MKGRAVAESFEVEIEMCDPEPPDPEVTYSQLRLTEPGVTVKGVELRCENERYWSVIEWEPSYWYARRVFLYEGTGDGSFAQRTAELVFWQFIAKWSRPDDDLIPASPARRSELAMSSYRVSEVAAGLLLPPPWQPQPTDTTWDEETPSPWLDSNREIAVSLGHSVPDADG